MGGHVQMPAVEGGRVAHLWHVEELEFSLGERGPYGERTVTFVQSFVNIKWF